MIVKHIPIRSIKRSDFVALAQYISDPQGKEHRIGEVRITNCSSQAVDAAASEILATQRLNTRAESDKTYHLVVSFAPNERPDSQTIEAIERRICDALGFGEHERISAVHDDTDHLHLHIAINKIHPALLTIHDPHQSYRKLGVLCEQLEAEFGLTTTNHQPKRSLSEGRASDMEQHAGIESLMSWMRRECAAALCAAPSWKEFQDTLSAAGIQYQERGNGAVFVASDGTAVKASTVHRDLSKAALLKRLGPRHETVPNDRIKIKQQYQARPVRTQINTAALFAKYKADLHRQQTLRSAKTALLKIERQKAIEAAKLAAQRRRTLIKVAAKGRQSRATRKLLYAQAAKALRDNLQEISARFRAERVAVTRTAPRQTWADWLQAQAAAGDPEALAALRARAGHRATVAVPAQRAPATIDSITKAGTIIYRAGAAAVRDDGDRLQLSRGADEAAIVLALRVAMTRYGSSLTVAGSDAFKASVARAAATAALPLTFKDADMERRRQMLIAETHHERTRRSDRDRHHAGAGPAGERTARDGRTDGGGRSGADQRGAVGAKPNLEPVGRAPPPEGRNRLRNLPELGVVRVENPRQLLLPRDVPGQLEQQRPAADDALRRPLPRTELIRSAGEIAATKYLTERNQKRAAGIADIPIHSLYTGAEVRGALAGMRQIDGQNLALIRQGDSIFVVPVDEPAAKRLQRAGVGEAVQVRGGTVRLTKGRSQ